MRTRLGPIQSVLIRRVSLFQGLCYMHETRLEVLAFGKWLPLQIGEGTLHGMS